MKPLSPTELRHTLHRNPEIAFQEFKTTELIVNNIRALDRKNQLKIHQPYPTGALIEYKINEDPYLLFRADIDALPIKEENEIDFKSQNEYMHACGHDVHTSILYSLLKETIENNPAKNILFFFQPAEESGGGAMKFYDTGIFETFNISQAFALHVTDEYTFGTVASTPGVLFASALEVDVDFYGVSSHVAFPDEGKNAFNAMRLFLDEADKMKSVISEPFIFGIGKIESGFVRNIAPGHAKIQGSVRSLRAKRALEFLAKIDELLAKIKDTTGVNYTITKGAHYPEVIVDETLFKKLSPVLSEKFKFIDCGYKMTGEDFGFFSQKYPSFMLWLGVSEGERYGLHNPKFLPPDKSVELGKNVFMEILSAADM